MHKRLPELERKIEDRERRREREKREWEDARNKRNERHGRYDDRDDRYSTSTSSRQYRRERDDEDPGYSRGSYGRNDLQESSRRDRSRDREYERPRTPPASRSPPAPPPAVPSTLPPPPSPRPNASPAPNTKKMTTEERQAFLRAEAKRRIDARTQALGLSPAVSSPSLDTTVEERLAQERKEAEEKARQAEQQAEERKRLRKERLEAEKASDGGKTTPGPTPTATVTVPAIPAPTRPQPPPVKSRAPPPPLPKKAPVSRPPVVTLPSVPPAPAQQVTVAAPTLPEIDPEEEKIRAREETLRNQREARAKRLRQLEQEEEEARRAEELYQARRQAFLNTQNQSPTNLAPPTAGRPAELSVVATDVPPQLPPQPAAASSPSIDKSNRNPFSRLMKDGGASFSAEVTPSTNETKNPFPRSNPVPPPPPKSPTPAAVKTPYHTAPGDSDDDWEPIDEKIEDDSSDDEIRSSRDTRSKIAQQLFGNILPARPQSAEAGSTARPASAGPTRSTPPAPSPPLAPPAAVIVPPAPPAAPMAAPIPPPAAPPGPIAAPPAVGDVSALMRSIQGGLRLKKTQTVDRSGPALSGKVLGDQAPPSRINVVPRPASPPNLIADSLPASVPMSNDGTSISSHRQSVDWYAGLAADQGAVSHLPPMAEEDEKEVVGEPEYTVPSVPQIQVVEPVAEAHADPLADIDKSVGMCHSVGSKPVNSQPIRTPRADSLSVRRRKTR